MIRSSGVRVPVEGGDGSNHEPMATAQSRGWGGTKPECELATLTLPENQKPAWG
jgi:hypothetical protein